MESKITYETDGWEIIIKNLWNKAKAINRDFRGISDKEKFIKHVLGKEIFETMPSVSNHEISSEITRAGILVLNERKDWKLYDIVTYFNKLIQSIEIIMKSNNEILILIGGAHYYGDRIEDSGLVLEEIRLSKSGKSYLSILDAVKSADTHAEIGYIISNDQANEIIEDFNLELKCENDDVIGEKSALFIYRREVICLKEKRDYNWFVYHVKPSVCL